METLRLSPSRVNEYRNCPQLYKYRTIDKLPEPPSVEAERGTLIHSVLEDIFEFPALDRTLDQALSLLPKKWEEQVESKPELPHLIENQIEWLDRASALLSNYFSLEKPHTFESTFRELHLERDLSEAIYLHGYVDRLDIAPTGEVRIVDYKTGKSPKPGWEEKAFFQLRVYALLYWRNHGVLPRLLQIIYLGDSRMIRNTPTESDLLQTEKALFDVATEIVESINKNEFKAKPSRLCNWCFFKPICPAHVN